MAKYSEVVAAANLPEAPEGKRYVIAAGIVVRDQSGNPVLCEKKKRGSKPGAKRKGRKASPQYSVPEGKLRSHETPGFTLDMQCLKADAFADVLDFHKWSVWYFGERAKAAQARVDTLLSQGNTPEERSAVESAAKLSAAFQKLISEASAGGNSALSAAILQQLGQTFANAQAKVG